MAPSLIMSADICGVIFSGLRWNVNKFLFKVFTYIFLPFSTFYYLLKKCDYWHDLISAEIRIYIVGQME